jgi:hypothetical protein
VRHDDRMELHPVLATREVVLPMLRLMNTEKDIYFFHLLFSFLFFVSSFFLFFTSKVIFSSLFEFECCFLPTTSCFSHSYHLYFLSLYYLYFLYYRKKKSW